MEEHHTHNPSSKSNKGIWYVLAVILLLLFIFGLASNKKKQETTTSTDPAVYAPTGMPVRTKTGSYVFNLSPGSAQTETQATFSAGSAKTVAINMNTEGKSVLGYNLIIQYDPSQITIGKITSAIPAFTATQNERVPGFIVVDGVKSSPDNTPVMFNNSPILNVPVTANSAGMYELRLIEKNDRDEAKFFDETMTPYYPAGGVMSIQSK